jgi:hypothetical protein
VIPDSIANVNQLVWCSRPAEISGHSYPIALPIYISCASCLGWGLGERPPIAGPSNNDTPFELLVRSVLSWLTTDSSSGSNHEKLAPSLLESLLIRSRFCHLKLPTLLALVLLLRLFVLIWPGGGFDNRELCRFTVPTKGSAPGIVSSVRPMREFGALARKEGESGYWEVGDITVWIEVGDAAHVQPGGLPSIRGRISGFSAAR